MKKHIIISYIQQDQDFGNELAQRLQKHLNIQVKHTLHDHLAVNDVKKLMLEIEQALAVVIVLSSHSATSDTVLSETMHAVASHALVVPLLIEDCQGPLTIYLNHMQWIDVRDGKDPLPLLVQAFQQEETLASLVPIDTFPHAHLDVLEAYQQYIHPHHFALLTPHPSLMVPPSSSSEIHLCTLGRNKMGQHIDVVVQRPTTSRPHAYIRLRIESNVQSPTQPRLSFILYDNITLNGTFVNGTRIEEKHVLQDGDQIGLGETNGMLVFSLKSG